jgi:hypothetical protein
MMMVLMIWSLASSLATASRLALADFRAMDLKRNAVHEAAERGGNFIFEPPLPARLDAVAVSEHSENSSRLHRRSVAFWQR